MRQEVELSYTLSKAHPIDLLSLAGPQLYNIYTVLTQCCQLDTKHSTQNPVGHMYSTTKTPQQSIEKKSSCPHYLLEFRVLEAVSSLYLNMVGLAHSFKHWVLCLLLFYFLVVD